MKSNGQTLDIVTEHEYSYWFYVPAAGTFYGKKFPFDNDDIPNDILEGKYINTDRHFIIPLTKVQKYKLNKKKIEQIFLEDI